MLSADASRHAQNVAIAISTDVYDHIDGVGEVGGIVGKRRPSTPVSRVWPFDEALSC